jgi:hypothetical protein
MGFLDSLESNLSKLESREEAGVVDNRDRKRWDAERSKAQASATQAEQLKKGPYTAELLRQVTRIGHAMRTKVHLAWIGSTLRLEARQNRLELRPTPDGVVAVFIENGSEVRTEPVDFGGKPEDLASQWLTGLAPVPQTPPAPEIE